MSFKVYVASGLANYKTVIDVQKRLSENGLAITFDWAGSYERQLLGPPLTPGQRARLAEEMERGVREADLLFLILPAKRGAHVEFGIAVGCGKPVVIHSRNQADDISFYLLPSVVGLYRDLDGAVAAVVGHAMK